MKNMRIVDFFGVSIVDVTLGDFMELLYDRLVSRQGSMIMSLNLTSLRRFNRIMYDSCRKFNYVTADGNGLVRFSTLLKRRIRNQIAICDLSDSLLQLANDKGLRVFLLGARSEVNAAACVHAVKRYPGISIMGRDGYFSVKDYKDIIQQLRFFRPDIILVGISSPKKEEAIQKVGAYYGPAISVACGGYIDILACHTRRAPLLLRKLALEWLFRFSQEPRRLLGPMLVGGLSFLILLLPRLLFSVYIRRRPLKLYELYYRKISERKGTRI